MDTLSFKTISANKATVNKEWVIVDAEGQTLGRLCAKVAKLLRGKYKPNFTPHVDCGDNVIIINADKVVLTGNKWNDRIYLRYTGYPGGQIEYTPADLLKKGGDRLFRKVVKGMLPKNRLGAKLLNNMYVYEGTGKITINKRELEKYFPSSILQFIVKQPLAKLNVAEQYDIKINLDGGGFKGQSEAARLAISRALIKINPEDKAVLRAEGFVTRDPRAVERKKPGRPKARKRFQFSKR